MLEVWATLYELTGEEKYLALAKAYDHPSIFRKLEEGKDALTNCHANASIPWAHGAAKMYEITGDDRWKKLAEDFFRFAVTERGTYCTGGQNAGEFWVPPKMQGHFLGDRNQEFCTVYNMVRLADYLYRFTGKAEYADITKKISINWIFGCSRTNIPDCRRIFCRFVPERKRNGEQRPGISGAATERWCRHRRCTRNSAVFRRRRKTGL